MLKIKVSMNYRLFFYFFFKRCISLHLLLLIAGCICTTVSFGQGNNNKKQDSSIEYTATGWKVVRDNFFSFKYPSDWVYKKDSSVIRTFISVTPPDFADIASLRMVEIVE